MKFPPTKFPVKSADFSKNLPQKILRNLTFSAKIPRNRLAFLQNLTFLPRKFCKIGRFFREYWLFSAKIPRNRPIFPRFCPWKSREILLFFSAKYQKPCLDYEANSSIILWVERNTQKCDNRICADDPPWMILVWKPQVIPSNNNNDFGKITVQSISVEFKIIVDKTGWCLSF